MLAKMKNYWIIALAASLTALVCGGVALFNAGVMIDENNVQNIMITPLWFILGLGILGTVIALPGWAASRNNASSRVG